jgi:hypothetical protein
MSTPAAEDVVAAALVAARREGRSLTRFPGMVLASMAEAYQETCRRSNPPRRHARGTSLAMPARGRNPTSAKASHTSDAGRRISMPTSTSGSQGVSLIVSMSAVSQSEGGRQGLSGSAVPEPASGSQSLGLSGCLTDGSPFVEPPAGHADNRQLGQRAGDEAAAGSFVEQFL